MSRKNMNKVACLISLSLVVLSARAEDPEVLGFWTFDGTPGEQVTETRETVTLPNHVTRTDDMALKMLFVAPPAGRKEAPLPVYSDDLQFPNLFANVACTNRLLAQTSSLRMPCERDGNGNTYDQYHASLQISHVGSLLKERSFTLEMIVRLPYQNGWAPIFQIGPNTGDKMPLVLQSNTKNALISSATPTAAIRSWQSVSPTRDETGRFYLNDGLWHHVALQWDQSLKRMTVYVDYAQTLQYSDWASMGVDLCLVDAANIDLFPCGWGAYNHEPTIQAIRLTRGDLPRKSFLYTSSYESPVDTVAHYRFDGPNGETFCVATNSALPRTDFHLWQGPNETSVNFVTPGKPYVKVDGELMENKAGVGGSTPTVWRMRFNEGNPAFVSFGESFTHELFIKFHNSKRPSGGHSFLFGEAFGDEADSTDGANWYFSQQDENEGRVFINSYLRYKKADGSFATASLYWYTTTNVWHHLAISYDAATRTIRRSLDYQVTTTVLQEGESITRGTHLGLPCGIFWCNKNGQFDGEIDEYRISRRALSVDEYLKPRKSIGLVIYMK